MPPSSANSFIPKRNPVSRPQSVRRYNLVIMPVISYTLFMSSLIAAGALFIYQIRVEAQFAAAATNLDDQIKHFNDTDLNRVVDFNQRLELANKMVTSHVSLIPIFSILESITTETVQFKNLKIVRKGEHKLTASASLVTSALDGLLFQKVVYQQATYGTSSLVASTKIAGVNFALPGTSADGKTVTKGTVTLNADFDFDAEKILYKPLITSAPVKVTAGSETINPITAPVVNLVASSTKTTSQ